MALLSVLQITTFSSCIETFRNWSLDQIFSGDVSRRLLFAFVATKVFDWFQTKKRVLSRVWSWRSHSNCQKPPECCDIFHSAGSSAAVSREINSAMFGISLSMSRSTSSRKIVRSPLHPLIHIYAFQHLSSASFQTQAWVRQIGSFDEENSTSNTEHFER